jgi:hypothetical protein
MVSAQRTQLGEFVLSERRFSGSSAEMLQQLDELIYGNSKEIANYPAYFVDAPSANRSDEATGRYPSGSSRGSCRSRMTSGHSRWTSCRRVC